MSAPAVNRIVIAEDDPPSRALLARLLSKAGYDVIACEDGALALEVIRHEVSCLVIADWKMPNMDGLELCDAVRQLCEMQALGFIYFILLTAQSDKDEIVAGLEAGADDYLTKPYHKRELLARIKVGERLFKLQHELTQQQKELHQVNRDFAQLNQRLEELANTDTLTKLPNRRHLFDRFEEIWALTSRNNRPLSCIMLDIDKFKLINDTHGHAGGDLILKKLSGVIKQCMRRYDVLGRIGGEEFCILCPDTGLEGTGILAERVRAAVEETEFHFGGTTIPATVSLGVATRCNAYKDPDSLIGAADAMLYQAKEHGRNQVWACDCHGAAAPLNAFMNVT